ncbi:MAG: response regulator transcription factor [Solirubrobacteraceae bacterium]
MIEDVEAHGPVGVCEDDATLRSVLERSLRSEGMSVVAVSTGRAAIERFSATGVAAIVLDIGLPDADGRDVCLALRASGITAPVLFLTARSEVPDRVSGFTAGGDDYLTKPFALEELVVRVRALLRRAVPQATRATSVGLHLDPAALRAEVGDIRVELTPTEFRLLAALVAASGTVVRRRALVATAWPGGAIVHDNTLDTYLKRLRRHLRELDAPVSIRTVRGIGYELR